MLDRNEDMTTLKRFYLISLMVSIGCATLPNASETIEKAPAGQPPGRIVSAKGLLSPTTSKAIMDSLARSVDPTDILQRFTAVIESISGTPATKGNKVTLLIDGPATYSAMFTAIQNARVSVNLESYIF